MTNRREDVGASNGVSRTVASYVPLALLVALVAFLAYGFVSGGYFTGGF
jgi:hypothetical protein